MARESPAGPETKNEMHAADSTSAESSPSASIQTMLQGEIDGGVPEHFILIELTRQMRARAHTWSSGFP